MALTPRRPRCTLTEVETSTRTSRPCSGKLPRMYPYFTSIALLQDFIYGLIMDVDQILPVYYFYILMIPVLMLSAISISLSCATLQTSEAHIEGNNCSEDHGAFPIEPAHEGTFAGRQSSCTSALNSKTAILRRYY